MAENEYTVYKHTAPNGKIYIGLTQNSVKTRWGKDGNGYKTSRHFMNAIKKYGWENIRHDIIATGLTQEEAQIAEKKLIKHYDLRNPDKGYNQQAGGSLGWKGMKHTEESKEKIRQSKLGEKNHMFGKKQTEEWLDMIRKVNSHPKSEETKRRMSIAQSNRSEETLRRLSEAQKKTPVMCIETGEIFPSMTLAARSVNTSPSNICNCIKGTKKTCRGFHWKYA